MADFYSGDAFCFLDVYVFFVCRKLKKKRKRVRMLGKIGEKWYLAAVNTNVSIPASHCFPMNLFFPRHSLGTPFPPPQKKNRTKRRKLYVQAVVVLDKNGPNTPSKNTRPSAIRGGWHRDTTLFENIRVCGGFCVNVQKHLHIEYSKYTLLIRTDR